MDEKQLQFLYNEYAKNKGFKDYSEFKGLMSSEGSRKLFFDDANKELGFKDYSEFNDLLGLKKKASGEISSLTELPSEFIEPLKRGISPNQTKEEARAAKELGVKPMTGVIVPTNLPKQDEMRYERELKTQDAAVNTLTDIYKKKGLKFDPSKPAAQEQIQDYIEQERSNDLARVTGKDGKEYLTRGQGFIEAGAKALVNSVIEPFKSAEINFTNTPSELADLLDKKIAEEPNVPESAPTKVGGYMGGLLGGLPKLMGLLAIPYFGESAMVIEMYHNAIANERRTLYQRGIMSKENGGEGLDREAAAKMAMETAPITAAPDAAMGLVLARGVSGKNIIPDAEKKAFRDALAPFKDVAKVAGLGGVAGSSKSLLALASGYDVTATEVLESGGRGVGEYALMDGAFKLMHKAGTIANVGLRASKAVVSAAKNLLSSVPKEILEVQAEKYPDGKEIIQKVEEFTKVKDEVKDLVPPEKVGSVAGLTEKIKTIQADMEELSARKEKTTDALKPQIDEWLKEYQNEIDFYNNQIKKVVKSKDPSGISEEIDDVTGEKIGDKKYIVDGKEVSQEAFEALQGKPLGTKEIVAAEVKPLKDIEGLKGEQENIRTEASRKIVNAVRHIEGFEPYTGPLDGLYSALKEADEYHANSIFSKLNNLEKASEAVKNLPSYKGFMAEQAKLEVKPVEVKKEIKPTEVKAEAKPTESEKSDVEKTLYPTLSGSIPLSEALPNGVYKKISNDLFAYADKGDKIAAIVDRANGNIVSKSFWNAKDGKWQLPNKANLKDDAKRFGINEDVYIKKYQDAVDILNSEVKPTQAKAAEVKPTEVKIEDVTSKQKDEKFDAPTLKSPASNYEKLYVPKKVVEEAYKNDKDNNPVLGGGGQSLETIIRRGGYSIEELNNLLPNWKDIASVKEVKPTEIIEKFETFKPKVEKQVEPKILSIDNKEYTTKTGRQKVVLKDNDLKVIDIKTGKEASPATRRKALDEYVERYDFSKGKTAQENTKEAPEGLSSEEVDRFTIEQSENPLEVASAYIYEEPISKFSGSKDAMIAEFGVGKVTQESFKRWKDENLITGGMALTYFNKKEGLPLDVLAKSMSDHYGKEIDPQDIAEFIVKYPSGSSAALRDIESPTGRMAAERFKELTGLDLYRGMAEKIVKAEYEKKKQIEKDLIKEEYETAKQLEDAYWAAYKETDGFTKESPVSKVKPSEAAEKSVEEAYKDLTINQKRQIINSKFDELLKELKIEKICPT